MMRRDEPVLYPGYGILLWSVAPFAWQSAALGQPKHFGGPRLALDVLPVTRLCSHF